MKLKLYTCGLTLLRHIYRLFDIGCGSKSYRKGGQQKLSTLIPPLPIQVVELSHNWTNHSTIVTSTSNFINFIKLTTTVKELKEKHSRRR